MKIKTTTDNSGLKQLLFFTFLLLFLLLIGSFIFNEPKTLIRSNKKDIPFSQDTLTIDEVLKHYKDSLIFVSVNDDASTKLSDSTRQFFKEIKGDKLSKLTFRASYVGIIKEGAFILEHSHKTDSVALEYDGLEVKSAGFSAGQFSILKKEKNIIKINNRGINLFILEKGRTITYSFDFFEKEKPVSTRKIHYENKHLKIFLDPKAYKKLLTKREEAVKANVLLSTETDFVPTKVSYNNQLYKGEIRLKGDWIDHLQGDSWSFRIKLEKEKTLLGMRKFSLHHPKTRNYVGEWLFHQLLKDEEIIGLNYSFVQVELVIINEKTEEHKDLGVYALEESFDKYLIERNKRREGVILKIDEDPLWQERAYFLGNKLSMKDMEYVKQYEYEEAKILPFSEKRVRNDSSLLQQFQIGRNLFKSYINGSKLISKVFDVRQLAKYNAICNILGANHALIAHNYRVYYNPISTLLEPIGFDANAFTKIYYPDLYHLAKGDTIYMKAYVEALEEVTQPDFCENILKYPGLKEQLFLIKQAFPLFFWDEKILNHNRHVILQMINPTHSINVFFKKQTKDFIHLSIENYGNFPVQISTLKTKEGQLIGTVNNSPAIILGTSRKNIVFKLKKDYQRIFVNKKKRKAGFNVSTDIPKLQVIYNTLGSSKQKEERILQWTNEDIDVNQAVLLKQKANIGQYDFLVIDENQKTITCKPGIWKLKEALIIPKGYIFSISGGTSIDLMHSKASIVSFSPIRFIGKADKPIEIFSSTNTGGGLMVLNTRDTSILQNCKFYQLSNPRTSRWVVSGAVNFYRTNVKINNCSFTKNKSEDALNLINTYFEMDNVVFSETQADAFDGDFVVGIIKNSIFREIGNDAIDISGSNIFIDNVIISTVGDKGLSAGENSKVKAQNIVIKNSEIAIASKDESVIIINKSLLSGNKLAFTAFQKKSEFGAAKIVADSVEAKANQFDFLIEQGSSMKLDGLNIETVPKVKERMYGIEFGKSSR